MQPVGGNPARGSTMRFPLALPCSPRYRSCHDLTESAAHKTLHFLPFDDDWTLTRETLDQTVIDARVSRLLDDMLGGDGAVDLTRSPGLFERNRRIVATSPQPQLRFLPHGADGSSRPIRSTRTSPMTGNARFLHALHPVLRGLAVLPSRQRGRLAAAHPRLA